MRWFYSLGKWFKVSFRFELEQKIKANSRVARPEVEWDKANTWFKLGVPQAFEQVDQKRSGFDRLAVKHEFHRHGRTPHFFNIVRGTRPGRVFCRRSV